MSPQRASALTAPRRPPAELPTRLRSRRAEIEEALLARMRSVADPSEVGDADYVQGLRRAVRAALEHAIEVLESSHDAEQPLPPQLAAQARLAARRGVGLEVVIRRYVAGHTLLCDYLLGEAGGTPVRSLQHVLRGQGALLDRIVVAVVSTYREEIDQRHGTTEQSRAEHVRRLLAGEPHDAAELGYDLDLWHLGVLASGSAAASALRELAAALDRRLLAVPAGREELWGWLGGHRKLAAEEVMEYVGANPYPGLTLAIGESARGMSGWRLTHQQAKAALSVALREKCLIAKYSDVAILASVLGDEILTKSLSELYLAPLADERDGGAVLRDTLRAYFAARHNTASTAAALGVSRQTVIRRLNSAEQRLGRPLESCRTDLETALRLHDLVSP